MKRIRFELYQGNRPIASVMGYVIGNFCVYKLYRWHIGHLHTHIKLLTDFARRKDALAVVAEIDSDLWDFDGVPSEDLLKRLWKTWTDTVNNLCVKKHGVWRLPKQDVADTTE